MTKIYNDLKNIDKDRLNILEWAKDEYIFYIYDWACYSEELWNLCVDKYEIVEGELNFLYETFEDFINDLFNVIIENNYKYEYKLGVEGDKEFVFIMIMEGDEHIGHFQIFKIKNYGEVEEIWYEKNKEKLEDDLRKVLEWGEKDVYYSIKIDYRCKDNYLENDFEEKEMDFVDFGKFIKKLFNYIKKKRCVYIYKMNGKLLISLHKGDDYIYFEITKYVI
ncbi:MAG: hypothetical protein ACO2O4_03780 [Minisyncoccia bacterium]|jgi:hypothetical protein